LADLAGLTWLDGQAERLAALQLDTLDAQVDTRLQLGQHADLLSELAGLTARHPYRERLHAQLMLALYRSGRQAEALEAYRRLRRNLADDLGLDPGAAVRELEAAILRHDPSLDPPRTRKRPKRAVPRQLPADVPGFTGREDELGELDEVLKRGSATVTAICGTAGVGKTALAVHWAHRVADQFPGGQLYMNLRGFDAGRRIMDPAEAVRRILQALGVPPGMIPAELDAQAALYRTQLAGRHMLIVLDNARDTSQVRPLLPGSSTCLVVVTSRHELSGLVADGAHPIVLDLPSAAEARELLVRRIGAGRAAAEPDAIDEMVAWCARLPLALTVVAARAATHPRLPLGAVAADLRDACGRLAALAGDDPNSDVRAVFSWSYRALAPPTARLFRLLGLHPGPDVSAAAAASLAGLPPADVRPLLEDLARAGLVVQHTAGRFAFHDLLRIYATDLAGEVDTEGERHAAKQRMLDHYLRTAYIADRLLYPARDPLSLPSGPPGVTPEAIADAETAVSWFTAEHRVLLAAIDSAAASGLDEPAWQLAWAVVTFLNRQGHWHELSTVGNRALAAGRRLADPYAQAQAWCMRAYADTRLGWFDAADTDLRQALGLYADPVGRAHAHLNLAYVYERRDRPAEALDHSQRALELYRSAGHRRGQAIALNAVGWCHALLGAYEQARSCCAEALPLLVELDDRNGQADTLDSLGFAHRYLGEYDDAVDCYRRAVDLIRELGDRYREATTVVNLGEAHRAGGDADAARRAWQQALAILEHLDHPDAAGVRRRLASLDAAPAPC
jgi:tetratricopeptide (TPR) repeat protein